MYKKSWIGCILVLVLALPFALKSAHVCSVYAESTAGCAHDCDECPVCCFAFFPCTEAEEAEEAAAECGVGGEIINSTSASLAQYFTLYYLRAPPGNIF
jgi:hypothetical protein